MKRALALSLCLLLASCGPSMPIPARIATALIAGAPTPNQGERLVSLATETPAPSPGPSAASSRLLKNTPPASGGCDAYPEPVGFSPDNSLLYLWGTTGVQAFNLKTQQEAGIISAPGPVVQAAASADGKWLALALEDGTAFLVEAQSAKTVASLGGIKVAISVLKLSAKGDLLAAGSHDGFVRVWSTAGPPVAAFQPGGGAVVGLGISPDGRYLATVTQEGPAAVWELPSEKKVAELKAPAGGMDGSNADFAFDDSEVIVGFGGGPVRLYSLPDGQEVWNAGNYAAAYAPQDYLVAFSSQVAPGNDAVTVKESSSGNVTSTRDGFTSPVTRIVFSPDGSLIAASSDTELMVFRAADGELVYTRKMGCG